MKLMLMRAGSFIVMPVGSTHYVETREETLIQVENWPSESLAAEER